ncbi:hypothetical protein C8F04DRAFT_1195129 [Mycena alexandri]|uniref:Uncharacterized protein n=1 Tax=Mycena alexandri TaxID=1745969 RepID=A0AAD6S9T9_9AGAR|nr:hypothetical protein C8F04DRAFT_1195129 [Mycena alexandri]
MFKRYDAAVVPDIMPLPELLRVATTKAEQTPVPKLNEHQRSWIFDVALRGHDLPKMPKDNVKEFYEKVKTDAFAAKAFQHTVQPGDAAEEACLPARVERWLIANPTKTKSNNKKSKKSESESADGNVSDVEEDAGARVGLLRGFPKAGWRLAIQKVLTNKRGADKTAHQKRDGTSAEKTNVVAPALEMAKVFGIATQTGRDKFREEHRDDIRDLSKMLPGSNAGGKSRKAEAQLWANEDPEEWKAAAATEEGVNWVERQQFVTGAIQHMVETLNTGGKFRPFLATMVMGWLDEHDELRLEWVEALPQGLHVHQRFEDQYPKVTTNFINAMHGWAKQPLQEYAAARDGPLEPAAPVFSLTAEALDDMSPNAVAQAVTTFLIKSYQAAFGNEVIPWATIASKPEGYYDTSKFNDVVFTADGPQGVKSTEWFVLGAALAAGAGEGSSGFFRKVSDVGSGDQEGNSADADEQRKAEEAEAQRQAEEAEAQRKSDDAEAQRQADDAEAQRKADDAEAQRKADDAEAQRKADDVDAQRKAEEADAEAEAKRKEEDAEAKHKAEAEAEAEAKRKAEEAQANADEQQTVVEEPKKKDRKRKAAEAELHPEAEGGERRSRRTRQSFEAAAELQPEAEGGERRSRRTRKSPEEAEAERQEKAETAKNKSKAKPGDLKRFLGLKFVQRLKLFAHLKTLVDVLSRADILSVRDGGFGRRARRRGAARDGALGDPGSPIYPRFIGDFFVDFGARITEAHVGRGGTGRSDERGDDRTDGPDVGRAHTATSSAKKL